MLASLEVVMWSVRFQRLDLLEERPAVSGGREKAQREEMRCQVESDTAEGPVAKTMRVLLAPSFGKGERLFDRESEVRCFCTERATEER